MNAAEFDGVSKTYPGRVAAVRGATLAVPVGGVFGLLGPNRAGKTTLVKMLLSLCRPTAGRVCRLGAAATDRRTLGRVGYMHENHAFPRYLSASEVLHFYGGLSGVGSAELGPRAAGLLERVGLADRAAEPIGRFSKGMVQRLGLAQALINDPDFLVLDEPAEGLDLLGRQLLKDVVRSFRSAGKTVLLVSHALPEVEELCDRVAVIAAGEVAYTGRLAELTAGRSLEAALRPLYAKAA